MCSRWRGSIPLNGSSRSRIDGLVDEGGGDLRPLAHALRVGRRPAGPPRPRDRPSGSPRAAAASGSGRRWRRAAISTNSRPVRNAWTASRSGTRPIEAVDRRVAPGRHRRRSGPARLDGRRSPASMWRIVVLPAPFGPRRPVMPGAERERDVVDRDDVAVPARDVVEDDRRRRGRPARRVRRSAAGRRSGPVTR